MTVRTRDVLPVPGVGKVQGASYSNVVTFGSLVFIGGQIALNKDGQLVGTDIETQTRQVFANLKQCLEAAGCTFADLLKVNVFLRTMNDFATFKTIYADVVPEPYPARRTVQAILADTYLIEVDAIAGKRTPE